MQKLKKICDMVLQVEEGLMFGSISFKYDSMMSAMKPGHPMEILDDILAEIFWDIQLGKMPEREKLENTLENFKMFSKAFKIKEMNAPINALEDYLYPKIETSFPILIGESGESSVAYNVSCEELEKLRKATEKGMEFQDAPGLKTLYKKIMKKAKEKLEEDIDLTSDDMDIDNLEYCIDYPKFPDEKN